MEKCKRCLLLEAGENAKHDELAAYIKTLDKSELVSDGDYKYRIEQCKNCDYLISGMCLKCGCYVELRARLKDGDCPDVNNKRW